MDSIFNLEINSNTKLLCQVEDFIKLSLDSLNLSDDNLNTLLIAVTESVNNAIIHGNKSDINKKVKIQIKIDDKVITVKIKDEGKGFSVEEIPNPLLPENLTKESGRGLFIIRSLLDSFSVNVMKDGTEVTMVLNLKNC